MAELVIHSLQLGAIGTNCYIVHRADSNEVFIVDPGDDAELVVELVSEHKLAPVGILVTHCHWDHIGAVAPLAKRFSVPVWMNELESSVLEETINDWTPPGVGPFDTCHVDHKLNGGEQFTLAGIDISTLHTPGHSPGTIAYHVEGTKGEDGGWITPPVLFDGDLIFEGSIGRVDLPMADADQMVESIRLLLDTLSDDTILLSGHGAATTLGIERQTNPFVAPIAAGATTLR